MHIEYKNGKVMRQCTVLSQAKKDFPGKVPVKLLKLINFIEAADNLYSVINNQIFNFHDLKGNKEGLYAIDIDGRKSSYRLLVSFEDASNEQVFSNSVLIEDIIIKEVSKHYE